jgi:hypothetical protein
MHIGIVRNRYSATITFSAKQQRAIRTFSHKPMKVPLLAVHLYLLTRSNPTNTRSLSERSPIIFRTGMGSFRTNVGTARIWLSRASCGCRKRSITSRLYLPFNCSSQINLRLRKALAALGVCPAIYKRKSHLSRFALVAFLVRRLDFDFLWLVFTGNSSQQRIVFFIVPFVFICEHHLFDSSPFVPCLERHV